MRKIVSLSLVLLLVACSKPVVQTDKGVVVTLSQHEENNAQKVNVEVWSEKIIRVETTPERNFPVAQSLIVVPQEKQTPFEVCETDSTVIVKTSQIAATVDKIDGKVSFSDLQGNLLLQEDGKSFTPIEVEQVKGWSTRMLFQSPDDEAFYGLGQHQSEEYNYKGKNEELFQYNTKVSLPFVISNKNYGLLWDNYSLGRFGNPNDYRQLYEVFKLYDKTGNSGGLTGSYVPSRKGAKTVVRTEDSIYFADLKTIQNLPASFPLSGSTVTYEGFIEAPSTNLYRFNLYYAGYMKVYVNNQLVVSERWRTAWNPNSYKFTVSLKANEKTPLRIEWEPDGGQSYCALRAMFPQSEEEQNKLSVWNEMAKSLDYYFIAGDSMDEVIAGYRQLTGKCPIMPKWVMGFWQSRQRYSTQTDLLSVLKEFRERQIPIDNMVQDWFYWREDNWGSHEFDSKRFPNPKAMVDTIHQLNARLMLSVWPKFYVTTDHYKEFEERGWMYKKAVEDSLRDWVGKGYLGSFYDAYSTDAQKLFWKQIEEHLYPLGIDAWWMDASEPDVQSNHDLDYRKKLSGPTALGPSTQYLNAYALENAKAIYEGQRGVEPNRRVFLLTRSGFAGLQRYSTATWSGDIGTRWEDMKSQITAGLNFSMSGIPYWSMDIGGFCVENRYARGQREFDRTGKENDDLKEWRELNTRWYQFGAFVPLFRAHGEFPLREPWNIAPEGHPAYSSILYYMKLRYNLMPYIYSLAGWSYWKDYTLMRGLVMDYGSDVQVNNIGDQYMFGPSLMVCPVYTYGARERNVYFPSHCGWYDFYTGKHIGGGQSLTVSAPYERMPLFVPEGAIIPGGPDMQYSTEKQPAVLSLFVYQGANGSFTYYEDDGLSYDYEKGDCAFIEFTYDNEANCLSIGERKGTFKGMLKERIINVVYVTPDSPRPFDTIAKGISVLYNGTATEVNF